MALSVIIPTYHRAIPLHACVTATLAQLTPSDEIIVVSQGDDSFTHPDPRVHTVHLMRPSLTRARNAGIAESRHEIIIFLDDDALPGPGCIERHRKLHTLHHELDAIGGGVHDVNSPGTRERLVSFDPAKLIYVPDYARTESESADFFAGGHVSFKRRVFEKVLFDPWFIGSAHFEEVDVALRMKKKGMRIWYEGSMYIEHGLYPTGGCRAEVNPHRNLFYRFYNRGFFFAKNMRLQDLPVFLTQQRHECEFFTRKKSGGHCVTQVVASIAGTVIGVKAGLMRRVWGSSRVRPL